jgi:hypothetical protein
VVSATTAETVYYSDENVRVTGTEVAISGQTYPLHQISAVRVGEFASKERQARWRRITIIALVLWAFVYFLVIYPLGDVRSLIAMAVPLVWVVASIVWMLGNDHVLTLLTDSGQVDALTSRNKKYVQKVASVIDETVRRHGWPTRSQQI